MQKFALPAVSGAVVFAPVFAFVFAVVFALSVFAPTVCAQVSDDDDRLTILITASRFAETADETLAPVTVITRRDIEEKQAETMEEVLRTVPGISFGNNGGVGKVTSLFLRGTESNHVLVLIDGVKVGNATAGLAPFQDLPLDQIEKIEVVRGPRSSLYGSEAIGGVIQIFTRKGDGETRPHFSLSAGSHNTQKADIGLSGGGKDAWYHLGASAHSTDGFNACRGSTTPFAGCFIPENALEDDGDGYENQSVSLRGGAALSDSLDIEGNFLNADGETEFDGGFQNETETTTRLLSVKATWQVNPRWQSSLLVAESKDEADNFKDGAERSTFDTAREQINWQNDFRLNAHNRLVAGVDYRDDEVDSSTDYSVDSRDNTGVFALLRMERGASDWQLALRNDDDEQFGNHATGSAAWGRDFGNGKRITFSYGAAFSAPAFNDLYWPGSGNPNLKPENSKSFDLGFSHSGRRTTMALNVFHTQIDDLIEYVYNAASPGDSTNVNINQAEIIGMELAAGGRYGGWDVRANATLQRPENAGGGANDGNQLARRPRRVLTIDIGRQVGKHRIGAEVFARGRAYDDAANTRRIPGYTLLNLRAELRLHKHWSLALKVNNATDKQYETVAYYPQDGRNYFATLRYIH